MPLLLLSTSLYTDGCGCFFFQCLIYALYFIVDQQSYKYWFIGAACIITRIFHSFWLLKTSFKFLMDLPLSYSVVLSWRSDQGLLLNSQTVQAFACIFLWTDIVWCAVCRTLVHWELVVERHVVWNCSFLFTCGHQSGCRWVVWFIVLQCVIQRSPLADANSCT